MQGNKHLLAAALAAMACAAQAQAIRPDPALVPAPVAGAALAPTTASPEMQRLMATAQDLREAIQLLAQKAPGPQRDVAIARAQEALLRTQQAMILLPPEYRRTTAAPAATGARDPSVLALMDAADSLRKSIQAMAQEPAGERRNEAIRQANRALLDTQVAMTNAYDATAFPPRTTTLGAGPMQCTWLGGMWGCS